MMDIDRKFAFVHKFFLVTLVALLASISLGAPTFAAVAKIGAACTKGGSHQVDTKGNQYVCQLKGKKLLWSSVPKNVNPNGVQNNPQRQYALGRLGSSCNTNGQLAWNGEMTGICKNGKVAYPLAIDVPKAPANGFTSRPDWYPSLSQIFGGSSTKEPACVPSTIKFTFPIIPLDKMAPIVPYGLTVGGHVTPIDHAYIGLKSLSISQSLRTDADYVPVTAPADGTIIELSSLGSPTSHRVVIDHGCNVVSVYMVLNKVTGVLASLANEVETKQYLRPGIKIKAGQEFGRQRDNMLDFNVFDGTAWLSGFQNPQAYLSADTWKPYTADFLPFFSPNIRSAMEAQLQKTSAPRVGKIDYDVAGTASGNWFLQGSNGYGGRLNSDYINATSKLFGGSVPGKNEYSWSHLAIAPHQVDTTQWIFSSGWWKDPKGDADQALLVVGPGQVAPNKLTASTGMVVYKLTQISYQEPAGAPAREPGSMAPYAVGYAVTNGGADRGVVALQVNSDGTLSVEINTTITSPANITGFTSAKRTYSR